MEGTKVWMVPGKPANDRLFDPRCIHRGDQILHPCDSGFRIFINGGKSPISLAEGGAILSDFIRKDMGMAVYDHGFGDFLVCRL
jgi:hypothetical protein